MLQGQWTPAYLYLIHPLRDIQFRGPLSPPWESDSDTMVLSFLPLLRLLSQFLFQHFLSQLIIKCWGSSELTPRSSSHFPILYLSKWFHRISLFQILFTFVKSEYISLIHTSNYWYIRIPIWSFYLDISQDSQTKTHMDFLDFFPLKSMYRLFQF